MSFKETKSRSLVKAILFRILALIMCYTIIIVNTSKGDPVYLAIELNVAGFLLYYFYERTWNRIEKGRH